MVFKKVFEGIINDNDIDVEDGGQSLAVSFEDTEESFTGLGVRVSSWDEDNWTSDETAEWDDPVNSNVHSDFKKLIGKKVRVTVEVIK